MKKTILLCLGFLCCPFFLLSCGQETRVIAGQETEAPTPETALEDSPATASHIVRSVTTIQSEVIFGALEQLAESNSFTISSEQEEKRDDLTSRSMEVTNDTGCLWRAHYFETVRDATQYFDLIQSDYEVIKQEGNKYTDKLIGVAPERSIFLESSKDNSIYQSIQQDNLVFTMESSYKDKETLSAFSLEYLYSISGYFPSALEEDDANYLPEQNEFIYEEAQKLIQISDELELSDVYRINDSADLYGENPTVSLSVHDEELAITVTIFSTEALAEQYVSDQMLFNDSMSLPYAIEQDDYGSHYILKNDPANFQELLAHGNIVLSIIGDISSAERQEIYTALFN